MAAAVLARGGWLPTSQASVVERIVLELRAKAAELLNARNGSHRGGPHWQRFNYASELVSDEAARIEQKHGGRS